MVTTGWRAGRLSGTGDPRLVFGRMYEDAAIELAALPEGRVLAIASAGDVAFALAGEGRDVTAVDINPAQVAYVKERISGGRVRSGQAEGYLSLAAKSLPLLGLNRHRLESFFDLDDTAGQVAAWRRLAGRRFRIASRLAFGPALRLAYRDELARSLPADFGEELTARLERGFGRHPNRTNPLARALFGLPSPRTEPHPIEVACAEVIEYLREQPDRSFDGFAYSNILDGAAPRFREDLIAATRRVSRPGAKAVLRTLGMPRSSQEADLASRDRALVWGGIEVVSVG
jgi:S-adenosylmethionine:diacylglycerol 3-amino-3-carboxypropyl transferase